MEKTQDRGALDIPLRYSRNSGGRGQLQKLKEKSMKRRDTALEGNGPDNRKA